MKWVHTPISFLKGIPLVASITYPEALALATSGVCLVKNIINIVQLWKASKILVGVDLARRQEAREAAVREIQTAKR